MHVRHLECGAPTHQRPSVADGGAFYAASSVAPEIPERLGGKRRVANRVPDVLVAQTVLDRACIVPAGARAVSRRRAKVRPWQGVLIMDDRISELLTDFPVIFEKKARALLTGKRLGHYRRI